MNPADRGRSGLGAGGGPASAYLRSTCAMRRRKAASCSWISSIRFFFAQYSAKVRCTIHYRHMQKVLIRFGDATLEAIDRIAPAAKQKRAEFIRSAVKDAIFQHEQERMRDAYRIQP